MRIMFPMVATVEEVLQARQYLLQAHRSLEAEQQPHLWPIETGIMVEIPSAALMSPTLAQHVDFFSIGTNDLIQYTMAVDRMNEKVAYLYQPFNPALLRLIRTVIQAAHREGKWAGMCGEMAGNKLALPILLGGIVHLLISRKYQGFRLDQAIQAGTVLCAGLVAGEALTGIFLAVPIGLDVPLPLALIRSIPVRDILSVLVLIVLPWTAYRAIARQTKQK